MSTVASGEVGTDRARLAQAREVIRGARPHTGDSNAVYAAYVAVIAFFAYGIPASRAFFTFVDPAWVSRHLTGLQGTLVEGAAVVAAMLLAYRLGSIRGPVVPDLPYLDHVASSGLDRAVVLRRWWRLSLSGCLLAGLLLGAAVGGGMTAARVASLVVLAPASVGGVLLGLLVAGAWLWGQVRSWPSGRRGIDTVLNGRRSLRALHLVGLRTQAARAVTVGGGVLAGDLRAVRLDVAAPTTRARRVRLRAHGPVAAVVARDALGLRRSPGAVLTGTVLSGLGCWAIAESTSPGVPSIVAFAGVLAFYLGFGAWSEGLRLQGDNAGTSPMLGLPFRSEALAHLVAPAALSALVSAVIGGWLLTAGRVDVFGLVWPLALTGLLAGSHLMAAFRGLPPTSLFTPGSGVATVALWYSRPLLLSLIGGVGATALLARGGGGVEDAVLVLAATTWAALLFGLRRVRLLDEAHRA